jgi:cytochrome c553
MKHFILLATLTSLIPLSQAANINAGKSKAASCAACHGQKGISANPAWPNLAGQKALYLKNQIIAFRDGARQNAMMSPMVKSLSDEDAANVAAYYESLKP